MAKTKVKTSKRNIEALRDAVAADHAAKNAAPAAPKKVDTTPIRVL